MNSGENQTGASPQRKKYVRAVGPRLRLVLYVVFGLVALLGANSAYLASITFLEWVKGLTYQNYFYQCMFLAHLVLGLLLVVPFVVFGAFHIKNAHGRPNRRAVRVGYLRLLRRTTARQPAADPSVLSMPPGRGALRVSAVRSNMTATRRLTPQKNMKQANSGAVMPNAPDPAAAMMPGQKMARIL